MCMYIYKPKIKNKNYKGATIFIRFFDKLWLGFVHLDSFLTKRVVTLRSFFFTNKMLFKLNVLLKCFRSKLIETF